jgi:hypothetical protein
LGAAGKLTRLAFLNMGWAPGDFAMPYRWEYREIDLNDQSRDNSDIDLLNDAGEEGWELVTITANGIAYLKRQFGTPPSPGRRRKPAPAPPGIE